MKAPIIDRAAVLRLAELAQLRLAGSGPTVSGGSGSGGSGSGGSGPTDSGVDEARVDALVRDLERIVAYATELSDVNVDGVAPMERPALASAGGGGGDPARGRPDDPHVELDRDVLLGEAPRVEASGFAVPAFMDEG